MSDDELFAVLSEIADEEIMARNRASIIEVGKRIRRAALEEISSILMDHSIPHLAVRMNDAMKLIDAALANGGANG